MINFTAPFVLIALAILPALWFLLKTSPPPPKKINLPTVRFLLGLQSSDHETARTPLWLLILRTVIAAFLILAFSGPLWSPSTATQTSDKPLLLIVDNGWSAAPNWPRSQEKALRAIEIAAAFNQSVTLLTTAQSGQQQNPARPQSAADARAAIRSLEPKPWGYDYRRTSGRIDSLNIAEHRIVWISDGLTHSGFKTLYNRLKNNNDFKIHVPDFDHLPLLLRADHKNNSAIVIRPYTQSSGAARKNIQVQAKGQNGEVLAQETIEFEAGKTRAEIHFDLPSDLKSRVTSYALAGQNSAGAVYILDSNAHTPRIGLFDTQGDGSAGGAFTSPAYYLSRALEPLSDLESGSIEDLILENISALILPDMGALDMPRLSDLRQWVQNGGVLIRFAGPRMVEDYLQTLSPPFLAPVPLRAAGRNLDGALSWDEPQKLSRFPANSPLADIALPAQDITVRRQILAQPGADLDQHVWATLEDGTPFITAAPEGRGLSILIHTTATPDWSDFALSGLFPEILIRLAQLSDFDPQDQLSQAGTYDPLLILDGFGVLSAPPPSARPLEQENGAVISPDTPPGLYVQNTHRLALNLGDHITSLSAVDQGVQLSQLTRGTQDNQQINLAPYFLVLAFLLFLVDWVLILALHRGLLVITIAIVFTFGFFPDARAQNTGPDFSQDIFLSFIETNNPALNARIRQGLSNLGRELARRTAIEPAGVHAIDIDQDELSFFPFIYWPVQQGGFDALRPQEKQKIRHYLAHGGTILFDTGFGPPTNNQNALRSLTSGLDIPPLKQIQRDHVLQKAFYLLPMVMDLNQSGDFWVADQDLQRDDNVSPVMISNHGWAALWAAQNQASAYELSTRFGINWIMVALTGHYKADQVHLPHILERLGD